MRNEYDFTKSRQSPYASQLKKQITIRLDEDAIAYFKGISEEIGIPYQSLINLYLRDCAATNRKLDLSWREPAANEARTERSRPAVEADSTNHGTTMSLMKTLIVEAINSKQTLSFTYNGRPRVVEPQSYGMSVKGTELLRAHQIQGGVEREPLFDVSKIRDLVLLDRHFSKPGPNYKKNDSALKTVFAQL